MELSMDKVLVVAVLFLVAMPIAKSQDFGSEQLGEQAVGAGPAGGFGDPEPDIGGLGAAEGAEAPDLDGDGVPDAFDLDSPGGLGTVPPSQQGVGMGSPTAPVGIQGVGMGSPTAPAGMQQGTEMQSPAEMSSGMAGDNKAGDAEMDGLTPEEKRVFELIDMYHKKKSKARG